MEEAEASRLAVPVLGAVTLLVVAAIVPLSLLTRQNPLEGALEPAHVSIWLNEAG